MSADTTGRAPRVSRWVSILPDGRVRLRLGKVELGQGILTALAQIAADELGVGFADVELVTAGTPEGPDEGFTSGSRSVMDAGSALRAACAQARRNLVDLAARRTGCPPASLSVEAGVVRDRSGGQVARYADLAPDTDGWDGTVEADAERSRARGLVGQSVPRVDLADKFLGRPRYVHDLRLPGQLFGRVVRPPGPGAALRSADEAAARAQAGVVAVVRRGSFLGVVAEEEDAAITAAEVLRASARWAGGEPLPRQEELASLLRSAPAEDTRVLERADQDARRRVAAEHRFSYFRPYLAHAAIGPSAAAARFGSDGIEVWTHSQGVYPLQRAIAASCGVAADSVRVRHVEGPGCYGHNGADDVAYDAVLLASAVPGRPVHVTWSRDDEFAWEPYGPAMVVDVSAGVDERGNICSWRQDSYGNGHTSRPGHGGQPGLLAGWLQSDGNPPLADDPPLSRGAGNGRNAVPGYAIPDITVTAHRVLRMPLRTSAMRSLGAMANVLAIECTMDRLALAAGADPVAYRLRHCDDPRARVVMESAAAQAGWYDRPRDGDTGRGFGYARYKGSCAYCAVVAEVEAVTDVRVRRLVIAVDAGEVINPDGLANQVEGGAVQAVSWTVREQVRFGEHGVTSRGWDTYPILTFSDVPRVELTVADRPGSAPLGVGECTQGPVTAAVANALADTLGVRIGSLPLTAGRVAEIVARQ